MASRTAQTLVIVGGGLAGARAAHGARDAGFDGRVVIVGEEDRLPYERPPLSKAVLRGEATPASAQVDTPELYRARDIEVVTGRAVTDLDTSSRRIGLDGGDGIEFTDAVLATGAEPRRLDIPGAELDGVHYLRSLDDSVRLGDAIRDAARVAVVGAGWIGSEVAASARQIGAEVVLVDPGPTPLHRVLGRRLGDVIAALHADHGVELRMGSVVDGIRGTEAVEGVALTDGTIEEADAVLLAVGVVPRVALATAAGLAVDDGITVDAHLRASVPGVYAAGDVANAWHPRYRRQMRVEHWANAMHQGSAAGANAAGSDVEYDRLPYFFSDQYDLGFEYVGHHEATDELAIRGHPDDGAFIAFWHSGGVPTAAIAVNTWDVVEDLRRVLLRPGPVDVRRLLDTGVALNDAAN